MTFDLLEFATLFVTGFTSCAEFGSYAFVHPVIRDLPPDHHVAVEKGLLKTFGRVMPVLMTLCPILSLSYAILNSAGSAGSAIRWCSAAAFTAALISTFIFNVPINLASFQLERDTRSLGILSGSAFLVVIDRIPFAFPGRRHPRLTDRLA